MWVHNVSQQYFPEATKIEVGSENHYLWKVQVDRDEGPYGTYRSKFWPANEPEPDTWLEKSGTVESKIAGSLLLLAHHVDVTFGDVKLRELGGDFDSPVISELQIEALVTEAVISWKTDELSTCDLTYWDDAADKNVIAGDHLVSQHAVSLENLESSTTYDLLIRCEDDSLNESTEEGEFETDVQLFALEILPSSGGKITVQDGYSDNLYQAGEMVTLNAEADPNKKFVKWTVSVEGVNTPKTYVDNPLPLEIIGDTTVTVLFGNNEEKIYIPLVQFSN
jgi:hypothetical protein